MDMKSTFLNEDLEEEVSIEKIEGFQLTKKEEYFCKLKKSLYRLKKAPRAWYYRLDRYQKQHRFKKEMQIIIST